MLKIVWLVLPRSGSEFCVRLTRSLIGDSSIYPSSSLTPGRNEKLFPNGNFHAYKMRATDYFIENNIQSLKLECPFEDNIIFDIAKCFPSCRYISTLRPFEKIANSHLNLPWGIAPDVLLNIYKRHTERLMNFCNSESVIFVDVDNKENFDSQLFKIFLGASINPQYREFIQAWPVVNSLGYRTSRDGQPADSTKCHIPDEIRLEAHTIDDRLRIFAEINNNRLREAIILSSNNDRRHTKSTDKQREVHSLGEAP